MKHSLLTTGIKGLVGSKLIDIFSDKYSFDSMDISDPINSVDITNLSQVMNSFEKSSADFIVHFAAYTDVTGAWKQNGDKTGLAYKVNVLGTENIVKACRAHNKHLIHISTAYVFDGKKEGLYTEDDKLNPIEWYGQTKADAENVVTSSEIDWTILRIDQPFRSDKFSKQDVVRRIVSGLKNDNLYPQFSNHYFGPTFIDDFALIVDWVIRTKATGLYNASSGESWSDYDFAKLINTTLKLGGEIKEGNLDEYLKTLDRPYQRNTAMSVEKLKSKLDFELKSIQKAVSLVKQF